MGLQGVELVLAIEDHFAIDIPDERTAGVKNVGDLARLVHELLQPKGDSRPLMQIFYEVRTIVAEHAAVSALEISAETRFVDDLHFD